MVTKDSESAQKKESQLMPTETKSADEYQHYVKHGHFPGEAKPSKFGNQKVDWGGMTFDSKWEWERYMELLALEENGLIRTLQRQVPIVLQPAFEANGEKVREIKYIADFTYYLVDGDTGYDVIEDAKGYQTDVSRLKWKMAKWMHRDRDMIFHLSRKAGLEPLPAKDKKHE